MQKKYIFISMLLLGRIAVIFVGTKNSRQTETPIEQPKTTNETITTGENTTGFLDTSKEKKTKVASDLEVLKRIYEKNKSDDILKQIIEKQAQNYQFNEAIENIKQLKNQENGIDPQLSIYIAINSSAVKVGDPQSIDTIMEIVNTYKNQGVIDADDVIFYQGLKEIWNENYNQALLDREKIQKEEYKTTIDAFKDAINNHKNEKSIPPEYTDGLVALTALKNGYFTIARKIAVECINKNEKYILPYQILAYSHFLSNNRETAIEYFLKLIDFDQNNKDMYNFLIGTSYYRKGDYSSSSVYLSQVQKTNPTDTLRYLIQDYIQLKANDKEKQIRTILAKQNDISPSDFSLYFYTIFYKSYFSIDQATIETYKELSSIFLQNCEDRFTGSDVCLYGKLGKATLENTIQANEAEYIGLAERYKMSYIYHILGDYFTKNKQTKKAEQAYAKAIALTEDGKEKEIVKEKLNQITP
ncbi:MAG: hypothetical protein WCO66_00335 [Candidatus Absconditabacteria bacterium]